MIVTVFRSRLKPEALQEYGEWAPRIAALAKSMPGYVSHKSFVAEDGERLTLVEFADEASQRAWAAQAQHVEAKKKGRKDFYLEYRLQICTVQRDTSFKAADAAAASERA